MARASEVEMIEESRVDTGGLRGARRTALIRDAAASLFNLEVASDSIEHADAAADIRIARSPLAGLIDVHTSWSIVERTPARVRAAPADSLLVYLVHRGGSWFRNARGDEFTTATGSIVVGSQDAAYKAAAARGQDWRFHALSVAEPLFANSGPRIRQQGFQLVPAQAAMHGLLSSYLTRLCRDFARLDRPSSVASLKALDELLAAALGTPAEDPVALMQTVAGERLRLARRYVEDHHHLPALDAAMVAAHLCVSPRQLHRVFEGAGTTLSAEIRRVRVGRAAALLRSNPALPVTEVAFACGFDSLPTFYRCFKAEFQATASEFRGQGAAGANEVRTPG